MHVKMNTINFTLSFDYDKKTIALIKTISGRKYRPQDHTWTIPITRDNFKFLKDNFDIRTDNDVTGWQIKNFENYHTEIFNVNNFYDSYAKYNAGYNFYTEPFKHQLACFNYFKDKTEGALFLPMGTGKTKIIVDLITYHFDNNEISKVLYICPASVMEKISNEFWIHSNIQLNICILQGPKDKKIKLLKENYDIYILNYESVEPMKKELLEKDFDWIVCDESTRIKNHKAKRSKALHELALYAKYKFIMSGLPTPQNQLDIFSQFKFLDRNIFGSVYIPFKYKYAEFGGFQNKEIMGLKNVEELQKKIYSIGVRIERKDCISLPEKMYEVRKFDLSIEEKEVYNKVRTQVLTELENVNVQATIPLTKLMKFSQITSGFLFGDENKIWRTEVATKLELLKEVINDILPDKIVIWCRFKEEIVMLCNTMRDLRLDNVTLFGDVPMQDRQTNVDKFNNDPNCKVFIGQTHTGGMGIDLVSAHYVIYYNNSFSLEDREQSEDRCHRIGQKNNVLYIDLVARQTIDEYIIKALQTKKKTAIRVIDDVKNIIAGG